MNGYVNAAEGAQRGRRFLLSVYIYFMALRLVHGITQAGAIKEMKMRAPLKFMQLCECVCI
jgi:hypothetical protein